MATLWRSGGTRSGDALQQEGFHLRIHPLAEEYWATVERLIASPTTPADRARISDLARRYAYLFWFAATRMTGVCGSTSQGGAIRRWAWPADDLRPGRNLRLEHDP